MKKIGVLTSGGDAPGMNAAIRAVVRTACENGIKVYGVVRGYNGLINGDFIEMDLRSVSDIINRGGTILYSARSVEFATEEGLRKAVRTCQEHGIEGVVVIGGDGSFRGARDLSERGIPCVGLPGTIDNDIACCDNTIGYDTCLNTIMEMVDRVRDTTESHDRCTVVEVMGRKAGYLALNAGIACGATSILIPEVEYDVQEHIIERMEKTQRTGKKHFIIIVAEGVPTPLAQFPSRSFRAPEPYGVCLILAPWNYPIQLCLEPLIGAISGGNCVVVKPSAYAPATSRALAKLLGCDPRPVCSR